MDTDGNYDEEMVYDIIAADLEENPLNLTENQVDKIHEAVWEFHNDMSTEDIEVDGYEKFGLKEEEYF